MLRFAAIVSLLVGCRISLEEREGLIEGRRCQVDTTPSCLDAEGRSDLTWLQRNVFVGCASSRCHDGGTVELDLRSGGSYAELVDVSSALDPSRKLVVPGDIHASYLMFMLGDFPGSSAMPPAELPEIGYMPPGGLPPLCCQKLDALDAWILAGAPNN